MALINTTTTGILGTTVYGDGQGALTVQKDGVTQGVYGNIPAFYVFKSSSNQSISSATGTLITYDTVRFDTCSGWSSANNRWTPNIAGYYYFSAASDLSVSSGAQVYTMQINKNGVRTISCGLNYTSATEYQCTGGGLIYMNGTTDYVSTTAYIIGTSPFIYAGVDGNWTFLTGFLVKAA